MGSRRGADAGRPILEVQTGSVQWGGWVSLEVDQGFREGSSEVEIGFSEFRQMKSKKSCAHYHRQALFVVL